MYVRRFLFYIFVIIVLLFNSLCEAQSERLTLAKCLRAECGNFCDVKEIVAILYVLKKRTKQYNKNHIIPITLEQQTKNYCAVFRRRHKKARLIKRSTFYKPLNGSIGWWTEIGQIIDLFVSGLLVDPYPLVMHWNCKGCDAKAIKCKMKKIVQLENTFWTNCKKR